MCISRTFVSQWNMHRGEYCTILYWPSRWCLRNPLKDHKIANSVVIEHIDKVHYGMFNEIL